MSPEKRTPSSVFVTLQLLTKSKVSENMTFVGRFGV